MSPRSILSFVTLAVVSCLLLVTFTSASRLDQQSLFDAESWPALSNDLTSPSALSDEISARHLEFIMSGTGANGQQSSTGSQAAASSTAAAVASSTAAAVASSTAAAAASSSAAAASSSATVLISSSSSTAVSSSSSSSTGAELVEIIVYTPATVNVAAVVPRGLIGATVAAVLSSMKAASNFDGITVWYTINGVAYNLDGSLRTRLNSGRRLLAVNDSSSTGSAVIGSSTGVSVNNTEAVTVVMVFVFTPNTTDDASASVAAKNLVAQFSCKNTALETKEQCEARLTPAGGVSFFTALQAANPTVAAAVNTGDVVFGTATVTQSGVTVTPNPNLNGSVASQGTARTTNAGYYFLGAVLAVFVIIAAVYFLLHKSPDSDKDSPDMINSNRRQLHGEPLDAQSGGAGAGAMDIVPEAGTAVAVPIAANRDDQEDPRQMDYKSVFALKHNVLDRKEDYGSTDPVDDNDVHFVLHQ